MARTGSEVASDNARIRRSDAPLLASASAIPSPIIKVMIGTRHATRYVVSGIRIFLPPNGHGIELPAARDLTMDRPTAARPCRLPMRAAGGWRPPAHPGAAAGQLQCLVRRRASLRAICC
jgi:hypothetical protein